MKQPAEPDDNEGTAVPKFDDAWVNAATLSERDIRRHTTPPAKQAPAPWRAWTPPEQENTATDRHSPPRRPRRLGYLVGVLLFVLGTIALRVFVPPASPAGEGTLDAKTPAADSPIAPPDRGTTVVQSTTPPAAPAAPPARPVSSAPRPITSAARPVPWTAAATMPSAGPDATHADVFATIKVGTCLAEPPDLRSIIVVSCSGPHSAEVTLLRDLTELFPAAPRYDQIQALNNQLCPAASQAWTGGTDYRYTSGYNWQYQESGPGRLVRGFACTVMLSGGQPFTGTLRHSV